MAEEELTLDTLLKLVENPIRRHILTKLAQEEIYPLQLSKELRVSQQAVSKHLKVLEQAGLVESYFEKSSSGPPRLYYRPVRHFLINISFGPSLFEAEMYELEDTPSLDGGVEQVLNPEEELRRLHDYMEELNRQRYELFLKRCRLMRRLRSLKNALRVEESQKGEHSSHPLDAPMDA
ncbi:ArsR/SmtB family transcription factor [Methermicoccus shengliensis]|uniref:ArsR/SmtB family transcription factor n=1 Tax=Methermicoccus shengliensis TaxID=660064 RepID=UPI000693CC74|nr:ArsR family transcriptional regulator [Methermicoccus shengliensis]